MTRDDYLACAAVLAAGYSLNLLYITIFYHRAVTHRALELRPGLRRFVHLAGNWVTGLDLKAWVCMHRIHHANADRPGDPHSPVNAGIIGVAVAQLRSYERVPVGLARRDPELIAVVDDLMSHPVQGWIVNSFGHAVGSRNFDTPDNSRNNHAAAWLIWGEGLQNNHHAYPGSAKFSYHWWEMDFGWTVARMLERTGVLRVNRRGLIPASPGRVPSRPRSSTVDT